MTEPRVRTEIEGQIAHVWLNRPDKLNGIELDMLQGLLDAAAAIKRNRDVRVVILQGAGESFCAGLDFAAAGKKPSRVVRSAGRSERGRWSVTPTMRCRVRRELTSTLPLVVLRRSRTEAAVRWLRTAPGPAARTAAIQRPR